MPRKNRLIKERARKLAQQIDATPDRVARSPGRKKLKNQFEGHVRDLARAYTEVAIEQLAALMTKSKNENMRLLASSAVLERGWGKPSQAVVGGEPDEPAIKHVHEVRTTFIG